ncbi:MAG: acyltransferase family protein [Chthoniobacteraceae bacterium]
MSRFSRLASFFSQVQPHPAAAYRPEIDGLRALAVLSVVFYHATLGFPGGYVGVDVFFVISGYVITSLLLRDLRAGRFSLAAFWERRIRRIFPALSAMVLATLVLGYFLLLPGDLVRLGKSAIAQALLAANIYFWNGEDRLAGYFSAGTENRPLLHTWSLAVEEQFYLFFPLILLALFAFEKFRRPRLLGLVLFLGGLASLALAVHGVSPGKHWAFFLLPSRAWELTLGALLTVLPAMGAWRGFREAATWLGLAGILLPTWLYSKDTPFPGLAALPPCLGTALVIWANSRLAESRIVPTAAGRWLAWRPVVFIGLISYSLYLWHWPVLFFGKYWWAPPGPAWYFRVGLLGLSAVLAVLSWRYLEMPFREKRLAPSRAAIFRFAAAATLLTLLLSAVLSGGFPKRFPEIVVQNDQARWDHLPRNILSMDAEDIQQNRLYPLGADRAEKAPKILLWGDSHAWHAIPAMDAFCREMGVPGVAAIHALTAPLLNFTPAFSNAIVDYVKRCHIPCVLIAARWELYQEQDAPLLEKDLPATIRALRDAGCEVWVLQDVPNVTGKVADAPWAMIWESRLKRTDESWHQTVAEHYRKNSVLYRLAGEKLPATFIDPAPQLLEPDGEHYRADLEGVSIYFDNDHLTNSASRALLLPLFREQLAAKLKAAN